VLGWAGISGQKSFLFQREITMLGSVNPSVIFILKNPKNTLFPKVETALLRLIILIC
jgi:hypothetical protein